jgi:hypothetical protein
MIHQLRVLLGTAKWCQCVTRFGAAASKRLAAGTARTRRDSVACTYIVPVRVDCVCVCVCLVIHTYMTTLVTPRIENRALPRISAIFLP